MWLRELEILWKTTLSDKDWLWEPLCVDKTIDSLSPNSRPIHVCRNCVPSGLWNAPQACENAIKWKSEGRLGDRDRSRSPSPTGPGRPALEISEFRLVWCDLTAGINYFFQTWMGWTEIYRLGCCECINNHTITVGPSPCWSRIYGWAEASSGDRIFSYRTQDRSGDESDK